jgi:hypothetical protein
MNENMLTNPQVVIDIPVIFIQCLVFSLITYFMYGLDPRADKFFIYVFTLTLGGLCFSNFFRYLFLVSLSFLWFFLCILGPKVDQFFTFIFTLPTGCLYFAIL